MVCCFFGHKDAPESIKPTLEQAIENLIISKGVDSFLVGNQGAFDAMALSVLRQLKQKHPHISYNVVLAYMPKEQVEYDLYEFGETMLPEGIESVHPKFAISWRNKWMVNESDAVICYVKHSWGGAAKYLDMAKRKKKIIINMHV